MENTVKPIKNGLVLGGGGSRGCYEIGAWRAFNENHIQFDMAAGVSIGAIVSAMYVQGSLDEMEAFVNKLSPEKIAEGFFKWPSNTRHLFNTFKDISAYASQTIFKGQQMDITPLMSALKQMFDFDKFMASPIKFGCLTYNLSENRPQPFFKKDFTKENAVDILISSASCYPAFPIHEMNGQQYIDGGYGNNLPIQLGLELGADRILAIDVEGPGIMPKQPECSLFTMKPILHLESFLDFSSESATKMELIGYLETSRMLKAYEGFFFTFKQAENEIDFLDVIIHFIFDTKGLFITEEGLLKGLNSIYSFSNSDLSVLLASRAPWFTLVEALGMMAQMNPLQIYEFDSWINELLERLNKLHIPSKLEEDDSLTAYLSGITSAQKTAAIYLLMKKSDDILFKGFELAFSLFPIETDCAAAWFITEKMYGKQEDNETDRVSESSE